MRRLLLLSIVLSGLLAACGRPADEAEPIAAAGDIGWGSPSEDGGYSDDAGDGVELNAGWIGGRCADARECSNPGFTAAADCVGDLPNGFCTQACQEGSSGAWVCPDVKTGGGYTLTRCIDAAGSPRCVAACDFEQSPTGCRPGYVCVRRERYAQPSRIFEVCLPSTTQRWPGDVPATNDVGAACKTDSDCGHKLCLPYPGGYCSKSRCTLAGCPSGTVCAEVEGAGEACLRTCTADASCRKLEGYACEADGNVCLPGPPPSNGDTTVGVADCASAWGGDGSALSPCDKVRDEYLVVRKSARNLALCSKGSHVASFRMGLGFAPAGDKEKEGDGKTPEGVFYIPRVLPDSSYYKAFLLSYPDKADAARGLSSGLINAAQKAAIDSAHDGCTEPPQTTNLGGLIEVHGNGGGSDWTLGCMAIEDRQIDHLWLTLGVGDTIVVLP